MHGCWRVDLLRIINPLIKKLASQTAIYGLTTMAGRFINFLLVPLYTARLAEVADYGQVNVMFSYAGFLAVILFFND